MTREETIICLQGLLDNPLINKGSYLAQALDMAIQALSQEPTNEKELNKAYTFGHNRGVKAYYNEQLCTVELPEAVFRYILSLVPTEEAEQEPCDDAISRDAVLEKMADYVASGYADSVEDFEEYSRIICQLPSVTQKSGKWIMSDDGLYRPICDKCGAHPWKGYIPTVEEATEVFKYCPNCGARMVEPQESE